MSFFDGYSSSNQVMVQEEDRMKIAFTTKWATFVYRCMPFGLLNVGDKFQSAMDEAIKWLVNKCIIIYMDDLMVFSKKWADNITNLKQVLH